MCIDWSLAADAKGGKRRVKKFAFGKLIKARR
jgi:hypothetical protein